MTTLVRILCLAVFGAVAVAGCDWVSGPKKVVSTAALKRAYWGLPQDGPSADVTSKVTCPNGFPCDAFANPANFGDNKPDLNKRLTVIWTCEPQRFVLSEVVLSTLKVRMECIGGAPVVPRTITILEASWGVPGQAVDVTQQVKEICGETSTRCQVPAMAYIFGNQNRNVAKMLRIRFTCNGQSTPGQQSLENGVADLRCERAADLGF
jgi:hypothetical protein